MGTRRSHHRESVGRSQGGIGVHYTVTDLQEEFSNTLLTQVKAILREGDTLVVWRLDRLGRSIKDLITWMSWLEQEGADLQSLHEALDTKSISGKLTFHIFAALAEFEKQLGGVSNVDIDGSNTL